MTKKGNIIGIGGVSCSGKSTLRRKLAELFPNAIVTNFDSYYIKSPDLADPDTSWESPEHYRYKDFVSHLRKIKENLKPGDLVITEGFLIFYDQELRDLIDFKIYLDLPEEEIIKRRLARNRGTESDIPEYVHGELLPGHRKYVYPQKDYADVVLDARVSEDALLRQVLDIIENDDN